MKGSNTYFGLESTDDIQRLQRLETDLDQRHADDIENRLELGRIYREVKALLPKDGTWGNWLKARHYSERESYRMIAISEFMDAIGDSCPIGQKFRSWAGLRHLDESFGHLQSYEEDGGPILDRDIDEDDFDVFQLVLEKIAAAEDRSVSVPMLEQFELQSWAEFRRGDEHLGASSPEVGGHAVSPQDDDLPGLRATPPPSAPPAGRPKSSIKPLELSDLPAWARHLSDFIEELSECDEDFLPQIDPAKAAASLTHPWVHEDAIEHAKLAYEWLGRLLNEVAS